MFMFINYDKVNYSNNNISSNSFRIISEGHQSLCTNCSKWLVSGYGIDHKKVKNYYDTSNVLSILNEPFTTKI